MIMLKIDACTFVKQSMIVLDSHKISYDQWPDTVKKFYDSMSRYAYVIGSAGVDYAITDFEIDIDTYSDVVEFINV